MGDRSVMNLTQNILNVTKIQQLAQGITGDLLPDGGPGGPGWEKGSVPFFSYFRAMALRIGPL